MLSADRNLSKNSTKIYTKNKFTNFANNDLSIDIRLYTKIRCCNPRPLFVTFCLKFNRYIE